MAQKKSGLGALIGGAALLLAGGGCGTWAAVMLLLGVIFAAVFPFAFGLPLDDLRLDRAATLQAPGEVSSLERVPSTTINEQAVYTLYYEFEVDGAATEDHCRVLELDALSQASPGAPLQVEYLPEDPSVSRPVDALSNPGGWAGVIGFPFILLGLVMLLAAAVVLALGGWLVRKAMKARRVA